MKSKIQSAVLVFILSSTIAFSISSCGKENQAPVVAFTSPVNNAMIGVTDSVDIAGTVTDEQGLHEMSVVFVKSTGDTLLKEYPYVHDLKTYSFGYRFHPLSTGDYTIYITADDHTGKRTTALRAIMVM